MKWLRAESECNYNNKYSLIKESNAV